MTTTWPRKPTIAFRSTRYIRDLDQMDLLPWSGEVTATVGLLIESHGPAGGDRRFLRNVDRQRTHGSARR